MGFYQRHVFICDNQKEENKVCCAHEGAARSVFDYLKSTLNSLGLHGDTKIRVTRSSCLGQCAIGPNIVIYPEGVWYTYKNQADIDEIIHSHLQKGIIVERILQKHKIMGS